MGEGCNWGGISLSFPATPGSDSHQFCPVPLDKVGRQACLLGPCVPGYDNQRSEGWAPRAASSQALGVGLEHL